MQVAGVKVDWHLLFKISCFLCICVCLLLVVLFTIVLFKRFVYRPMWHFCFRCCCLLAIVFFYKICVQKKQIVYKPLHCQTAALEPGCARPVLRGGRCHLDPPQLQSGGHDGETGKYI